MKVLLVYSVLPIPSDSQLFDYIDSIINMYDNSVHGAMQMSAANDAVQYTAIITLFNTFNNAEITTEFYIYLIVNSTNYAMADIYT